MNQSQIERERRTNRPLIEVLEPRRPYGLVEEVGDNHPDQPRFTGGIVGVVVAVAFLWAIAGLILWAFCR